MKKQIKKHDLAKERKLIFFIMAAAIVVAVTILSSLSSALAAETNVCCEKTVSGSWCQNAPAAQCDSGFKNAPTSCESTSFCKPGCCFNEVEGNCMESTPQRVCQESNGIWSDSQQCVIPQCNLGCCLLGDQGAFTTLTRCKSLSGFYGLKTDFRKTITDEATCIATAQQADKGACVNEDATSGAKTCVFTTRAACKSSNLGGEINITATNETGNKTIAPAGFYKDTLCTAPQLGSICGRSTKTTILDGKDEVYYTDTCGNIANIYDASRYTDNRYWTKVYKKSESCGYGSSNAKSATCGNCDYFKGSIARKATKSTGFPQIGDNICIDLSCKTAGKKHGESWCVYDEPHGEGQDTVGSRYYKEVCLFNEVITEPCADFRNEVCLQGDFGGFSEAACRVNRWQDCLQQKDEGACANPDVRDCIWKEGYYISSNTGQIEKSNNDTEKGDLTPTGLCLPNYPPGLTFWGSSSTTSSSGLTSNTGATGGNFSGTTPGFQASTPAFGTGYVNPSSVGGTSASSQCSVGNAKITFTWEKTKRPLALGILKGLTGERETDWGCAEGTDGDACRVYIAAKDQKDGKVTEDAAKKWAEEMNQLCGGLGDCGGKTNYLGIETTDGYAAYLGQKRVAGSGGSEIIEKSKLTSTGGSTSSTAGTSGASTTNPIGTINSITQTGTNTANTLNGKAVAPIQGRVISDYFKNLLGGSR